jgi:hypothetical protein
VKRSFMGIAFGPECAGGLDWEPGHAPLRVGKCGGGMGKEGRGCAVDCLWRLGDFSRGRIGADCK